VPDDADVEPYRPPDRLLEREAQRYVQVLGVAEARDLAVVVTVVPPALRLQEDPLLRVVGLRVIRRLADAVRRRIP